MMRYDCGSSSLSAINWHKPLQKAVSLVGTERRMGNGRLHAIESSEWDGAASPVAAFYDSLHSKGRIASWQRWLSAIAFSGEIQTPSLNSLGKP